MKTLLLAIAVFAFAFTGTNHIFADDYTDAMVKNLKKYDEIQNLTDRAVVLKIRGDFERVLQLKKNEWMVNYYMALCDLMLAWSYMGMGEGKTDTENLKKYTESAISLLNKSTDAKDDFAEAYIMKMSAQGNRWSYEPDKMNDIFAKMTEAKDIAKKLEPDNPRFYLIDGMGVLYTPESFGGGPSKALPVFEKSWENFQTFKPKDETYPNWGIDQAAGMIAMSYIQMDKLDDAKKWIDKALEVRPNSGFVKNWVQTEYDKKAKK